MEIGDFKCWFPYFFFILFVVAVVQNCLSVNDFFFEKKNMKVLSLLNILHIFLYKMNEREKKHLNKHFKNCGGLIKGISTK